MHESQHPTTTAGPLAGDQLYPMIAHELGNAVTSLDGVLALLLDDLEPQLDHTQRRMARVARDQIFRIFRLVTDLRDMEALELGKFHLRCAATEAKGLIRRSVEGLAAAIAEAEVHLSWGAVPLRVRADAERVIQVLDNLLLNALRHAPRGSLVRVWCEERRDEAVFRVQDEGPGIPADQLRAIFEPLHQTDAPAGGTGLGLGLTISRAIAEAHGGRLWAENTGHGARFSLALPLA